MDVATLRNIRTTWTDMDLVRNARQRLATLKYTESKEEKKNDFHFIIDDSATYTTWSNFRSKEAMEAYRQLLQKEKDLAHFKQTLQQKRVEYQNGNKENKKKLEPSILDLEKRILQLEAEIKKLETTARNLEVQKLRQ